jgi:ABC-type antimicrobial peptide transport system permease subunit
MKVLGQITIGVLALLLLVAIGFGIQTCSIAQKHATESMENAVISYDEYQNIYATCQQINDDLGVIKATPETDKQFTDFSKAQRINTLKMNLNRWINEYNAKSKHIDKKLWKSNDLPQELTKEQFSNY